MSGTYKHCSECTANPNCCCDFSDTIDNILVTNAEYESIISKHPEAASFFKRFNSEALHLLSQNGVCPFYDSGCSIYPIRPSDCRLFPFDLKLIGEAYYVIRYNLPCGSSKVNEIPWSAIDTLR